MSWGTSAVLDSADKGVSVFPQITLQNLFLYRTSGFMASKNAEETVLALGVAASLIALEIRHPKA